MALLFLLLACSRPELAENSTPAVGYSITGRVLDSQGVRPMPSVAVMLLPLDQVAGTQLLGDRKYPWTTPDYCRLWTWTDTAGEFKFDDVENPLDFVIRAQVTYSDSYWPDPWLFADASPRKEGTTEAVQRIELRLPPAGRLIGKLPLRADGYDTDWVVFAMPRVRSPRAQGPMSERGLETGVGFDGRFEFRYLLAGDIRLVACRSWNDHRRRPLGTVTISDGETLEREFTFEKDP